MNCPACQSPTRVLETRAQPNGATRRRRECKRCGGRFTTSQVLAREKLLGTVAFTAGTNGGGHLHANGRPGPKPKERERALKGPMKWRHARLRAIARVLDGEEGRVESARSRRILRALGERWKARFGNGR